MDRDTVPRENQSFFTGHVIIPIEGQPLDRIILNIMHQVRGQMELNRVLLDKNNMKAIVVLSIGVNEMIS